MKDGYKKTELGWIPNEWRIDNLNKVIYLNPESLGNSTDDNLVINYIDIESVKVGKVLGCKEFKFSEAPSRARRVVIKNDVIVSTVRPNLKSVAKINFDKENLICSTGFAVLRKKETIDSEYLFQFVISNIFTKQLVDKTVGSNYPAVNSNDIKETIILIPPLKEQEKIADILSTVDSQIDDTYKLIEKTKELKKGLMQRLLTKGIGHKEFKKTEVGEIPVEWELIKLGDLGTTFTGLSGKTKENFGNGKPYIPYKNIFNNSKVDVEYLEYVEISDDENQNKVRIGDIFFTTSSETAEEVGMSSVLLDELDEVYLNSFCFGYRLYNFEKVLPEFLMFLLRGNYVRKYITKLAQGSTRFNLSKNVILNMKIQIPNIEEQKKIANILLEVDTKIKEYENTKLKLEELKKGIMQKLLTGKIRVV